MRIMAIDMLNVSLADQHGLEEWRMDGRLNLLSSIQSILPTWTIWQYIMTATLGLVLYDQSK